MGNGINFKYRDVKKKLSSLLIIWMFVCTGLMGLLLLADDEDMTASAAGPTYYNSNLYITAPTTWTAENSPYVFNSSVYVYSNAKLTIEPGVIVKFNGNGKLSIGRIGHGDGDLWAVGNASHNIVFTSFKDDTEGGDTNNDGADTGPAISDWGSIHFYDVNNPNINRMAYCRIKYAEYGIDVREGQIPISVNVSYSTQGIRGYEVNAQPMLTNCNITNNTYGVYLDRTSAATSLQSNLIKDNGYGLVASVVPQVSGNTIENNSIWDGGASRWVPYNVCLKGIVNGDNTWYSSLSPYIVIGSITIADPRLVTIEPGTTLKFNPGYEIEIDGKLTAVGNASHRITFTSYKQNPGKGDWSGLDFDPGAGVYDNNNKLQYCTIEYSTTAIALYDSSPALIDRNNITNNTYGLNIDGTSNPQTITNNNITHNTYPVDCTAHIPSLGTNNISGNSYNNVTVGDYVTHSGTWTESESPYIVRENIRVYNNAKLTIEPGVVVKFKQGKALYAGRIGYGSGDIWAVGTANKRIIFTSNRDDSIAGDSNGDGANTAPAKSDWEYLEFYSVTNSNNNKVQYCDIKYAERGINFETGTITADKCNISLNTYGVYGYNTGVEPTVSNCNISNNTYGLYLDRTSAATSLQSNLIRDNNFGIVCNIVPTVNGNTIVNNSKWDQVEGRFIPYNVCLKGTVKSSNTWYSSLSPYIVIGDVVVDDPYHVTVQPGTTLKFDNQGWDILVKGKFTAVGNPAQRITFTSNRLNPAKGDWDKITLLPGNAQYDNENKFQYCDIEYSSYGLYLDSSSPALIDHNNFTSNDHAMRVYGTSDPQTVTNNIFSDNRYTLYCTAHIPSLSTNTFANNVYNNVSLGGYITSSGVWPLSESPYILHEDIYIYNSARITVQPGVTVKAHNCRIRVGRIGYGDGDFSAVGNATHRITFTSIKDDTIGGDTNGDGGNTAPQKGNWGGIYFYDVNNAVLNELHYCTIKYADYGVEINGDVTSLEIKYNRIEENNRGIYFGNGDRATVENNEILNNLYGIYYYGAPASTHVHNNDILGNTDHGIYVRVAPEVNATDNYWGSANGPTHGNNPGGNGDKASNNQDYTPFANYFINNDRPVSKAGQDQTVVWGRNATLDGKGSYDQEECPNGDAAGNKLVYDWNVSANYPSNQIVLNNQSSPTPHFTLVMNVSGTYTFTLVVRDPGGKWSTESTVHVHSRAPDEPTELWITQRDLVITADETSLFSAGANDSAGNRNYTWTREWEVTDPNAQMAVSGQYNETAVFHPHSAGVWTIRCNYSGGAANGGRTVTKQVTVRFGEVKAIIIETFQNRLNVTADNENLRITATGYDIKGNINNTWISTWDVNDTDARLDPDPNEPGNGQKRVFIPGNVGQWTIQCDLKEFGFTIVTANIKVNVSHGIVNRIDVTPKDQITTAGSTIQYSAIVYDKKNNTVPSNPTWSTDDPKGNISSGLYGAGQNGTWNIICVVDQIPGSTSVTVNKGALVGVEITTATAEVHANETLQFSARGYDVKDNSKVISFSWAVTDAEAHISQQSGLFTPKNVGTFKVYANYTDRSTRGNWSAEATIRVLLGRIYRLEITSQDELKAITVEQKLQLYAKAYDVKDNEYGSSDWTPMWQVDDPDGSVSSTGLFTPGAASIGIWTITCTDTATNIFNTTSVGVNLGQLSNIVISPSGATVAADKTLQLTATGYDTMNNSQDITDEVAWDISNGTIENGLFTPYTAGEYTIYANKSGRSGHVSVKVTFGKLSRIWITPNNPSMDIYDEQKFKGTGYDIKNNEIHYEWNWSITDSDGSIGLKGIEVTYTPGAPGKWALTCSYDSIRTNVTVDVTNKITITHNRSATHVTGEDLIINANIIGYHESIRIYYKYQLSDLYEWKNMLLKVGNTYEGYIPKLNDPGIIFYYIEVNDGYNAPTSHPELNPIMNPNTVNVVEKKDGELPSRMEFWVWDLRSGNSIKVDWEASALKEDVLAYRIYYSLFPFNSVDDYTNKAITLVGVENVSSTSHSRTVSGLIEGQQYYFAVTAVNEHGEKVHVNSQGIVPTKLMEGVVDANLSGIYDMKWAECPPEFRNKFDHYAIYVSTSAINANNKSQIVMRIQDILTTTATIRGLNPNKDYQFAISYVGDDGEEFYRETGKISLAKEEMGLFDYFTEYWEMFIGAISVLGAAFGFIAIRRKKKKVNEYRKEITDTYMDNRKEPAVCIKELKGIRQRLEEDVHEERVSENQYLIIREKLKDYMAEMKEKNRKLKKKEMKKKMKEKQKALVVVEKMDLDKETKEMKPKKATVVDSGKDFHAILGVASDATEKEIRAAFKKLAEKYHPDKVRHLGKEIIDVAARNMRELNEARDTLIKILKEGPESGDTGGADDVKLPAKEEAESLPVTEIVDEDRMLGQGEEAAEAAEGESSLEEKGDEKPEVPAEEPKTDSSEATSNEQAHEPETLTVEESEVAGEPVEAGDDEALEGSEDPEESTLEEPEEDAKELFASLDDDLPPPEAE